MKLALRLALHPVEGSTQNEIGLLLCVKCMIGATIQCTLVTRGKKFTDIIATILCIIYDLLITKLIAILVILPMSVFTWPSFNNISVINGMLFEM